jgi:hypothetical protein
MFRFRDFERKNRGLVSRHVLGLTVLSTNRVKRALHPRVNELKNEDDHSHVSSGEVQSELKHTPVPHIPSWHAPGLGV